MDQKQQSRVLKLLYLAYGIGAVGIYVLLMVFVFPWWHVSTHPVMVAISGTPQQAVELTFATGEDPLPLVPLGQADGQTAFYATELPPRPQYDLGLVFPKGTAGDVILSEMHIYRISPRKQSTVLRWKELQQPDDGTLYVQTTAEGHRIVALPGGRIALQPGWQPPPAENRVAAVAKATFGYLVLATGLFMLLATLVRFPDGVQAYRRRTPAFETGFLLVCALAGTAGHLYFVWNAMPVIVPGRTEVFLQDAARMFGAGAAVVGDSPGYAAFLKAATAVAGSDTTLLAIIQGGSYCLCVTLLALAMVRSVRGYLLGLVLILALLSPPAIAASLRLEPSSMLAREWALALAAFIFLWHRQGWARWLGWFLFGVFASAAAATGPAGVLLLGLPAAFISGTVWWAITVRGAGFWKLPVLWQSLGQAVVPVVVMAAVLLWAGSPFYLRLSKCPLQVRGPVSPFPAGMFDVRVLSNGPNYAAVIRSRVANGYQLTGIEALLPEDAAKAACERLPWQGRLAALGRITGWAVFLPAIDTHAGQPLNADYRIRNEFSGPSEAARARASLGEIQRQTGMTLQIEEKRPNRQVLLYNAMAVPLYAWFYRVLFFMALAGWIVALVARKYLAVALVLPFLINLLLQIVSMQPGGTTIQVLDASLWLGAAAGLASVSPRAMQKPMDDADRRCLPPIRPRRLLSKFQPVEKYPS